MKLHNYINCLWNVGCGYEVGKIIKSLIACVPHSRSLFFCSHHKKPARTDGSIFKIWFRLIIMRSSKTEIEHQFYAYLPKFICRFEFQNILCKSCTIWWTINRHIFAIENASISLKLSVVFLIKRLIENSRSHVQNFHCCFLGNRR